MATHAWLSLALMAWICGALTGWLGGTRRLGLILSHLLAALGALSTGIVGVLALYAPRASLADLPQPTVYQLPLVGPFGTYQLSVDHLSGLFLLVLGLVGTAAALYGVGYTTAWLGRRRVRTLAALFNVFLLAMTAVLTASDVYTFLLAWEAMSVSSFFLVVTEFEHKAVRQTGLLYLVMTHLATALIVLACLIWYVHEPESARSLGFDALRHAASGLAPWLRSLLFLLLLAGFGTKAGAVPLHIWLPRAHPVAPSHVSALMSGVMVKVGLYGIMRFAMELLGPGPVWWGGVLLAVGGLSALVGVIYANQESDLKRLLAYSTVENVGLMLIGLGVASIGFTGGFQRGAFAAYALLAVFFHVLAHGAYKGLLFLGAGAVLHGTGERSLEKLGGLIRRLPTTALLFFVGAMAIAGLPPLAGFVSEWLLMASLAGAAGQAFAPWLQVVAPLLIALIGMVAALVAATMVKAFGVGFLGMARTPAAEHAHEANRPMLAGMGLLALAVVGMGLVPRLVLRLISVAGVQLAWPIQHPRLSPDAIPSPVLESAYFSTTDGFFTSAFRMSLTTPTGRYEALWVAAALVVGVGLGLLATRLLGRRGPVRRSPVWASGVVFAPVNQYTAGSFAKPLRLMLRQVLRPQREVQVVEGTSLFPRRLRYRGTIRLWLDSSYRQVVRQVVRISRRVRGLQMGNLQAYLAYMFVALVLLLLLAR